MVKLATAIEEISPRQEAEYHRAKEVIVYEPGIEFDIASGSPGGYLMEGMFSPTEARREHRAFRETIESTGAEVNDLRDIILEGASSEDGRDKLLELAEKSVTYDSDIGEEQTARLIKNSNTFEMLTNEELLNIILTRPTYTDKVDEEGNHYTQHSTNPVSNLTFMRDQMITTPNGVILGSMSKPQRKHETEIVKLALGYLGITPFELREGATLEGGDYLAAGSVHLLGLGSRTNGETIDQIIDNQENLFGNRLLVTVHDPQSEQQHMHLDTYLSLIDGRVALLSETRHGKNDSTPKVNVYRAGTKLNSERIDLMDFLASRGYEVVKVSEELQEAYAINLISLGMGTLIGVDIAAKAKFFDDAKYLGLQREFNEILEEKGLSDKLIPVVMNHLNRAYGGPHCLTQVLRREK